MINIYTVFIYIYMCTYSDFPNFGAPPNGLQPPRVHLLVQVLPSHDIPQLEARHLVEASSLEAANYRLATLQRSAATCPQRRPLASESFRNARVFSVFFLVGGFSFKPFEKHANVKLKHFSPSLGVKFQKNM